MNPESRMKDFDLWSSENAHIYEQNNYSAGLSGYCMRKGHELLEKPFKETDVFADVLEIGAGTGLHLDYVNHDFDRYFVTDASESMLKLCRQTLTDDRVFFQVENAVSLSFDDNSFDRIIACHVLEHLNRPVEALLEWHRKCRSGGVISLLLPCDPGVMWRFGRSLGPRKKYEKLGLPYDFIMALEHVNSITNLVAIIRFLFDDVSENWWPLKMPNTDINLFYCVQINVEK